MPWRIVRPDADAAEVRFVELDRGRRIVQAVDFESDDVAYAGTMTMTWTFAPHPSGAEVSVDVTNAPPGVSDADHETGIHSSLANLAAYVTQP